MFIHSFNNVLSTYCLSRLTLGAVYRGTGEKGHCPLKPWETDKQKTSYLTNAECWSQVRLCVYGMGSAVMGVHARKRTALKREKLGILLASVDFLYSFIHTLISSGLSLQLLEAGFRFLPRD